MKRQESNQTEITIHINNNPVSVRINLDVQNGLVFRISFFFQGTMIQKFLGPISTNEKFFSSEDIEIEGIELHNIDKERIASCLKELLDNHLN